VLRRNVRSGNGKRRRELRKYTHVSAIIRKEKKTAVQGASTTKIAIVVKQTRALPTKVCTTTPMADDVYIYIYIFLFARSCLLLVKEVEEKEGERGRGVEVREEGRAGSRNPLLFFS
jgi:hypothetical protein